MYSEERFWLSFSHNSFTYIMTNWNIRSVGEDNIYFMCRFHLLFCLSSFLVSHLLHISIIDMIKGYDKNKWNAWKKNESHKRWDMKEKIRIFWTQMYLNCESTVSRITLRNSLFPFDLIWVWCVKRVPLFLFPPVQLVGSWKWFVFPFCHLI